MEESIVMELTTLIHNKLTGLAPLSFKYYEAGKISNFVGNDLERIKFAAHFLAELVLGPMYVAFITWALYRIFSWPALLVPALSIGMAIVQILGNKVTHYFLTKKTVEADKRVKSVNETFQGIKNIKFNSWEDVIMARMDKIRKDETNLVFKVLLLKDLLRVASYLMSVFIVMSVLYTYTKHIGHFTLVDALQLISYSNIMIVPTIRFVLVLRALAAARVSLTRIDKLLKPNYRQSPITEMMMTGKVKLVNVSASWTVRLSVIFRTRTWLKGIMTNKLILIN
jgi:ABC-type bacteriocin/lantibiotic exporter with double-glycine peptidase domain